MDALASQFTIPYGPRDAGIPLTLDEFEHAEFEEGFRYELIHGVLVGARAQFIRRRFCLASNFQYRHC